MRRRTWIIVALSTLVALAVVVEMVIHRAGPILKGRIIETLSTRFDSQVELRSLDVSILRGLEVSGRGLSIYPPRGLVAAGATKPLLAVEQFSFHSGIIGLFFKPMHVGAVHVVGMNINIPPREVRQQSAAPADKKKGKIKIVVDEFVCDRSRLIIGTAKPNKDPKDFELRHIELQDVGPNAPWSYQAVLTNAVPRGEIRSEGSFGPWQNDNPGDSAVTGHYTFDKADLNTIKGIGGILSSVGDFRGKLDRIVIDGTTDTPDFSLDTSTHPVPLRTRFHAIVDGTSGDTYLQPVAAQLRNSQFTAQGSVINIKGRGHRIALDLDISRAQIKDFLDLAVKTQPAVMTGLITTRTKLAIKAGKQSVSQKIGLDGGFTLQDIRFTNPQVQDKVDRLSLRAQGKPREAKAGANDVSSQMKGKFQMQDGLLRFSDLAYALPGATVDLRGVYSLDGQKFDFRGTVFTDASLPDMVDSRVGSLLLHAVSPFFHQKGGGAKIPVTIEGTKSEPKFGLDVLRKHSKEEKSDEDGGAS